MNEIASFSIQNPKQIINHLSLLIKNNNLLRVRFGANNESYITPLLGINEKNNAIVFDCGPKESLNNHILNADKVTFETDYKGIKVSFTGAALKKVTHEKDQAFIMPIPKTLFWMERREYYRVKIPLSKSGYCQLMLQDKGSINLKLHGLSFSGFSILSEDTDIFNDMLTGTSFEQCKLLLPEADEQIISFEIRYNHRNNPDKLQHVQRIGCKFTRLSRSTENVIQRYMQQIQREDLQEERKQNPEQIVLYRKIFIYLNDQ